MFTVHLLYINRVTNRIPTISICSFTSKATFTWEGTAPDSGDTLSYTVYVDKVDGKQTPASALTNLSAQTADVELDADTTYYWRVKS